MCMVNCNAFHSTGRVPDSFYTSSKIYIYTFDAGLISTYPDVNITISDELVGEFKNGTFQIVIIDYLLPNYVKAGQPAIIFTNNSRCSKMYVYLMCSAYFICIDTYNCANLQANFVL